MKRIRETLLVVAMVVFQAAVSHADTIIKLDLGSAGNDVELVDSVLSTIDDGILETTGDQNTNINFTGFLSILPDITTDIASFSLNGVAINGPASIFGGVIIQPTQGGIVELWDPSNSLLLSASVNEGSIVGALGGSATGSYANLTLGNVTGGSLASQIQPNSFAISFAFTDINGGAGFSESAGVLNSFVGAATANISGNQVPEPNSLVLLVASAAACVGPLRRYRRSAN